MTSPLPLPADRRLPALAATLAVHLAFLLIWRLAQPVPEPEPRSESMQWLRLLPLPRAAQPRADAAETPRPKTERHGRAPRPGPRPRVDVEIAATPAEPSSAPVRSELDEMRAPAPVQGSGETLMERARREVGAADRALTRARHRNLISAPVVTAHMRMQKGMELAYDLAPPGLFEKAKITEIIDPGGYGRRRYRVVTHGGTFCMTYESNHAPDGIDTMKNGIKPKITNCDPDEQPATEQKW